MALQARAIKSKISAVKNIGKITKAMELVSVSKMKKAVDATLASRPYARRALEILMNVSRQRFIDHELFVHGDTKRNLVVIVSSNKGLCGSYNVNVAKGARKFINKILAKHESTISAITVGRRSENIARKLGLEVVASFIDLPEEIHTEDVLPLVRIIGEEFRSGKYYNVVVVYTNYISALSQEVTARQILPVKIENVQNMIDDARDSKAVEDESYKDFTNYIFEPGEEEVVDAVLTELSEVLIYQSLLESRASEHSARMMAMKNATENAARLRDELQLSYNRARQAGITREISEIAAGAEALT